MGVTRRRRDQGGRGKCTYEATTTTTTTTTALVLLPITITITITITIPTATYRPSASAVTTGKKYTLLHIFHHGPHTLWHILWHTPYPPPKLCPPPMLTFPQPTPSPNPHLHQSSPSPQPTAGFPPGRMGCDDRLRVTTNVLLQQTHRYRSILT